MKHQSMRDKSSMDISVFTCVRDASELGGGVASAAIPIHLGLYERNQQARLLTGIPASDIVDGQQCLGVSGKGFSSIFRTQTASTLVHVHGLWTPFEFRACSYALRRGLPLVMSPHGMLEPWALQHKRSKKWLAWRIYQRRFMEEANLLVVNSWKEYRTIRALGLRAPVAVIENGVDVKDFDPYIERTDPRKSFLFLSRLSPVKGIFDLLESWASLPGRHGYELRIYGHAETDYRTKVLSEIKRLGLENTVKINGAVFGADKWKVYKNADVFILPSYSENFGIVVAEALLSGLPVITTKATPWDCLESEGMGWLVDNDPEQLADVILKAMNLPDIDRKRMGVRASVYANENFLWPNILKKYALAYEWVISMRSKCPEWIRKD